MEPALEGVASEPSARATAQLGAAQTLRRAQLADVPALRGVLARAFDQDPLIHWLVRPGEGRAQRLEQLFEVMLRQLSSELSETYTTSEQTAAAVWKREVKMPVLEQLRLLPAFARVSGWAHLPGLLQMLHFMEALHARLVSEPHWYLFLLGVEPAQQGRGLGGLLLAPGLARCDREQSKAYLETARVENLPFYVRHGFQVIHVVERAGWPKLWFLLREPQLSATSNGC